MVKEFVCKKRQYKSGIQNHDHKKCDTLRGLENQYHCCDADYTDAETETSASAGTDAGSGTDTDADTNSGSGTSGRGYT